MTVSPAQPENRHRDYAWFALVAGLTLVAYARSFTSAFQFDDHSQILESPGVQELTLAAIVGWGRSRVIPYSTLVLNYWIGGENPVGYHVANVLIHLVTCFAVFRLALALCDTPRLRHTALAKQPLVFALSATVLFACHPIQIQAVTYIVQRMSSMAAMFYVGSVLLYVLARTANENQRRSDSRRAFIGSGLLALAAFFSKENSASLPVAILLTEWAFFGGKGMGQKVVRIAPFLLLVLVIPLTWKLLGSPPRMPSRSTAPLAEQARDLARLWTWAADPTAVASPLDYFFTQCLVIPRYLRLVFLPWGFNIDHDVPVARGLSGAVSVGLAFLVALCGFGVYAVRRWPALGFGVLWFFVALSVESSVLPIHDVMNEHRMYLAMPGLALALASVFCAAVRQRRAIALGFGGAVTVTLVGLTIARNEVWRTQLSLWRDAMQKSPGKARVHVNVGTALHLEGKVHEAIKHYCEGLRLEPTNKRAESNINIALDELMESGEAELEIEQAAEDGSITLVPRHPCPPKN